MDLTKLTLFNGLEKKVDWLNQRQSVLSLNVANANTPGYVSQDLKPFDFKEAVAAKMPAPKASHGAHVTEVAAGGLAERPDEDRRPYELAPDGNAVVLEEQMIKATETAMDHQLMTSLYQRNVNLFKIALGSGR